MRAVFTSERDSLLGGLIGLAVGYPELGVAVGSSLVADAEPEAPAPFVVVKIGGDTYRTSPIGQTLAPRWEQPIAIPDRYPPGTKVLIQVLDAIDESVLGQRETTIGALLEPGAHTLTNVGEVASLDYEARPRTRRTAAHYRVHVDARASLASLARGRDGDWTPIPVWNGDRIAIRASGEVCPSRPTPCFSADGAEPGRWHSYSYPDFAEARHAALVGILPEQPVVIGTSASIVAAQAGRLILFVNDTDVGNNAGGFDVEVTVTPP